MFFETPLLVFPKLLMAFNNRQGELSIKQNDQTGKRRALNFNQKLTPEQRRKKEWLAEYPFLKAEVDSFQNRIEEEYNRTQRLTSTLSLAPVHTGTMTDDIWVDVFDNIDEVVRRFKKMQANALKKMGQIEEAIESLPTEDEKSVLTMRYLECKTFQEIAKALPYSERTVYNHHKRALEHLRMPGEIVLVEGVEIFDVSV